MTDRAEEEEEVSFRQKQKAEEEEQREMMQFLNETKRLTRKIVAASHKAEVARSKRSRKSTSRKRRPSQTEARVLPPHLLERQEAHAKSKQERAAVSEYIEDVAYCRKLDSGTKVPLLPQIATKSPRSVVSAGPSPVARSVSCSILSDAQLPMSARALSSSFKDCQPRCQGMSPIPVTKENRSKSLLQQSGTLFRQSDMKMTSMGYVNLDQVLGSNRGTSEKFNGLSQLLETNRLQQALQAIQARLLLPAEAPVRHQRLYLASDWTDTEKEVFIEKPLSKTSLRSCMALEQCHETSATLKLVQTKKPCWFPPTSWDVSDLWQVFRDELNRTCLYLRYLRSIEASLDTTGVCEPALASAECLEKPRVLSGVDVSNASIRSQLKQFDTEALNMFRCKHPLHLWAGELLHLRNCWFCERISVLAAKCSFEFDLRKQWQMLNDINALVSAPGKGKVSSTVTFVQSLSSEPLLGVRSGVAVSMPQDQTCQAGIESIVELKEWLREALNLRPDILPVVSFEYTGNRRTNLLFLALEECRYKISVYQFREIATSLCFDSTLFIRHGQTIPEVVCVLEVTDVNRAGFSVTLLSFLSTGQLDRCEALERQHLLQERGLERSFQAIRGCPDDCDIDSEALISRCKGLIVNETKESDVPQSRSQAMFHALHCDAGLVKGLFTEWLAVWNAEIMNVVVATHYDALLQRVLRNAVDSSTLSTATSRAIRSFETHQALQRKAEVLRQLLQGTVVESDPCRRQLFRCIQLFHMGRRHCGLSLVKLDGMVFFLKIYATRDTSDEMAIIAIVSCQLKTLLYVPCGTQLVPFLSSLKDLSSQKFCRLLQGLVAYDGDVLQSRVNRMIVYFNATVPVITLKTMNAKLMDRGTVVSDRDLPSASSSQGLERVCHSAGYCVVAYVQVSGEVLKFNATMEPTAFGPTWKAVLPNTKRCWRKRYLLKNETPVTGRNAMLHRYSYGFSLLKQKPDVLFHGKAFVSVMSLQAQKLNQVIQFTPAEYKSYMSLSQAGSEAPLDQNLVHSKPRNRKNKRRVVRFDANQLVQDPRSISFSTNSGYKAYLYLQKENVRPVQQYVKRLKQLIYKGVLVDADALWTTQQYRRAVLKKLLAVGHLFYYNVANGDLTFTKPFGVVVDYTTAMEVESDLEVQSKAGSQDHSAVSVQGPERTGLDKLSKRLDELTNALDHHRSLCHVLGKVKVFLDSKAALERAFDLTSSFRRNSIAHSKNSLLLARELVKLSFEQTGLHLRPDEQEVLLFEATHDKISGASYILIVELLLDSHPTSYTTWFSSSLKEIALSDEEWQALISISDLVEEVFEEHGSAVARYKVYRDKRHTFQRFYYSAEHNTYSWGKPHSLFQLEQSLKKREEANLIKSIAELAAKVCQFSVRDVETLLTSPKEPPLRQRLEVTEEESQLDSRHYLSNVAKVDHFLSRLDIFLKEKVMTSTPSLDDPRQDGNCDASVEIKVPCTKARELSYNPTVYAPGLLELVSQTFPTSMTLDRKEALEEYNLKAGFIERGILWDSKREQEAIQHTELVAPAEVDHVSFEIMPVFSTSFLSQPFSLHSPTEHEADAGASENEKVAEQQYYEKVYECFSSVKHNRLDELINLFERHHISVTERDDHGNTLLICAAQQGLFRIAKFLLRKGAKVNDVNLAGNSVLHYCFYYEFNNLGEYLRTKGADDAIQNNQGLTCYEGLSADDLQDEY